MMYNSWMLTRPDGIIHHPLYIIHEKSCRDVACHVDSTICHPEELATKDLAYIHFYETETLRFAQSDMERRISLHLSDSAFN